MEQRAVGLNLPAPGRVVRTLMYVVGGLWLLFAIGLNWVEWSPLAVLYRLLVGNVTEVAHGQVWRLLTAPFVHLPSGPGAVSHLLSTLFGLYFFGAELERTWGTRRFVGVLLVTAIGSYALQAAVALLLAGFGLTIGAKLVPGGLFMGALPVVEALAIAWAFSFKGRQVLLFLVLPVSSQTLVWIIVGGSLLNVIALGGTLSGFLAPFFGMYFGYLLGAGTPSPLRRFWLRRKLKQLDIEAERERTRKAAKKAGLRVIEGGKSDRDGYLH